MAEQQYMLPQNYFIPSKSEVGQLQKEAAELRAEVDNKETAWIDRTRSAERLKTVERRILAFREDERQAQVQPVKNRQAQPVQTRPTLLQAQNASPFPGGRYVLSDGGEGYLWIANNAEQVGNVGEPEQMYAECQ